MFAARMIVTLEMFSAVLQIRSFGIVSARAVKASTVVQHVCSIKIRLRHAHDALVAWYYSMDPAMTIAAHSLRIHWKSTASAWVLL